MLNIEKKADGEKLVIALEGRLDTTTAPQLESELGTCLDGVKELVFDLEKLEYISSAGLRVLLSAMQRMEQQGEMVVRNVSSDVMDVLEVTGFVDDLNIE